MSSNACRSTSPGRSWATVTCGWYGKRRSRASGPDRTRLSTRSQSLMPEHHRDEDDRGDRVERAGAAQVDLEGLLGLRDRAQVLLDPVEVVRADLGGREQRDVRRDGPGQRVAVALPDPLQLAAVGLRDRDRDADRARAHGAGRPRAGSRPARRRRRASTAATSRARAAPAASTRVELAPGRPGSSCTRSLERHERSRGRPRRPPSSGRRSPLPANCSSSSRDGLAAEGGQDAEQVAHAGLALRVEARPRARCR